MAKISYITPDESHSDSKTANARIKQTLKEASFQPTTKQSSSDFRKDWNDCRDKAHSDCSVKLNINNEK